MREPYMGNRDRCASYHPETKCTSSVEARQSSETLGKIQTESNSAPSCRESRATGVFVCSVQDEQGGDEYCVTACGVRGAECWTKLHPLSVAETGETSARVTWTTSIEHHRVLAFRKLGHCIALPPSETGKVARPDHRQITCAFCRDGYGNSVSAHRAQRMFQSCTGHWVPVRFIAQNFSHACIWASGSAGRVAAYQQSHHPYGPALIPAQFHC